MSVLRYPGRDAKRRGSQPLCRLGFARRGQSARADAGLALALLAAMPLLAAPVVPMLQLNTNEVPEQSCLEMRVDWSRDYTNPFDPAEVRVDIEVTAPSGERYRVPGFYAQDYERARSRKQGRGPAWLYPAGMPGWRARFAPLMAGRHYAVARIKDQTGEYVSAPEQFTATRSSSPGYVQVSRVDPRFLELRPVQSAAPGKPFFPIGQNLAFIGDSQYVSLDLAEDILEKLSSNGANYLRVWTCCGDWAIAVEARKSAFGRSWESRRPIVPCPGHPGRSCVRLSKTNATIRVDPSHRVALKPNTDYELTGRFSARGESSLRVEVGGRRAEFGKPSQEWGLFEVKFTTGSNERWQPNTLLGLLGNGEVWVSDLSLKEARGGPELLWEADLNRVPLGYYNQPDCFMVDELVRAAERTGIYLQLCVLTRDLYMNRLQDPASAEYAQAVAEAKNFLRYAVGRWGYSTAVATWEYWNEMDPGKPTEKFYRELGEFLDATDLYHHLKSTSTWGPSARDCRQSALDVADTHFYLRPADAGRLQDEVQAVMDRAKWLRDQAPAKPALLGEFGLADNQWRLLPEMNRRGGLADVHNALWASALSGLSGTALPWWWERLDQQDGYGLYRPLSRFLADVPWTTGQLQRADIRSANTALRILGLHSGGQRVWFWIFHKSASWQERAAGQAPSTVKSAEIELDGLEPGTWQVEWFDTRRGEVVRHDSREATGGVLKLSAPDFAGDLACRASGPSKPSLHRPR